MSSLGSTASTELPIDEHIVTAETDYELDDGKLVHVAPAHEPHAHLHATLAALLQAHAHPDFSVAVDMLIRISWDSDRAPDASVYPRARDPKTGGRQIEQLAFEIADTESLGHAAKKAAALARRGVRRVFAIDVERARVFEWSPALGSWSILDVYSSITDPALSVSLPVRALLQTVAADDSVARALLAKGNPVIEDARAESRAEGVAEGRAEGRAEALLEVLVARGLVPSPAERAQLLGERDLTRLARWAARVAACASVAELLATP